MHFLLITQYQILFIRCYEFKVGLQLGKLILKKIKWLHIIETYKTKRTFIFVIDLLSDNKLTSKPAITILYTISHLARDSYIHKLYGHFDLKQK